MTGRPLSVPVAIPPDVAPVVRAMARLKINIGSVAAEQVMDSMPAGLRLLCMSVADTTELRVQIDKLRAELADEPKALDRISRVTAIQTPLDTWLIVFLDVIAGELTE